MKPLRMFSLVAICILMIAGTAMAAKTLTATRVDTDNMTTLNRIPAPDCTVGNLEAPAWGLSGWVTGFESYKYLFNAAEQGCCNLGFQMQSVGMLMQFVAGTHALPQTFDIYADLEEAVWDPVLNCWVPGPVLCEGLLYTITIDTEGLYDIAVPLSCDCAFTDYYYFLTMNITTALDCALVVDNTPTQCQAWNNWGEGWADLYDWGFSAYGDLIMTGDVLCCDTPVATEDKTWGDLKNLFR
jgi:hypothetical protein